MSTPEEAKERLFERMRERYPAANKRKLERICDEVVEEHKGR